MYTKKAFRAARVIEVSSLQIQYVIYIFTWSLTHSTFDVADSDLGSRFFGNPASSSHDNYIHAYIGEWGRR